MYLQALGAILGLIACLYQYISGELFIIGVQPFLNTKFLNFFCGYTLYPLCIIIFLMSIFLSLVSKYPRFFNRVDKLNKFLTHLTVLIGLLGCKYYFIIPSLFILYRYYIPVLLKDDLKREQIEAKKQKEVVKLLNNNIGKHTIVKLLDVTYEEVEILRLQYCNKHKV